jgi:hypothetical protein
MKGVGFPMKPLPFLLAILAGAVHLNAQTAPSVQKPYVHLTWTNSAMSSKATTGRRGGQRSEPGVAVILKCTGGAATCSQASLNLYVLKQTATTLCPKTASAWNCTTIPQTVANGAYDDPEPYNSLMNYAVQNAWNSGGRPSPPTPILTVPMPKAPK